jgi:di/tricarboxylate transporter
MALTVAALYLFTREKISIESSSLLVLTMLALGFVLFPFEGKDGKLEPEDFFLGFGNDALIAICALMMASQGLVRSGALAPVGRAVAHLWGLNPMLAMLAILLSTMATSAFMNNTPQVVMMIPVLISVAARSGIAPSRTLMPMTFSAQIGGMLTPIGTGLNLLVISSAASLGVPRFGMFDFILPGMLAASAGLLYLWLLAPRLLSDRETQLGDFSPRVFSAILHVREEGFANGKSVAEVLAKVGNKMRLTSIQRGENLTLAKLPTVVLQPGDRLFVSDKPENLKEFEDVLGATLYDDKGEAPISDEHPLKAEDQKLAEIVVTETSALARRTLNQAGFAYRYDLVPLALHRGGRHARSTGKELTDDVLEVGDVILVQGPGQEISKLRDSGELLVLDATTDLPHSEKAPWALLIMALVVGMAALRILPIAISALLGVILMIFARCMAWRDALKALDASMIFLTAASLALSLALIKTGGADYLARLFVAMSLGLSPAWVLSALVLLMAILANIISNTSAAVIGTPIAVAIANLLGMPPEPFVLAVLFGANMGFATPMADNCNLLVFSAGGYLFKDFLKVGIPLIILMWVAFSVVLPQFYPLR